MATAPASAPAAAPIYAGVATVDGEWHSHVDCGITADSSWHYEGSYWRTRLTDFASFDARRRAGNGHIDWTDDNCSGDFESGTCPLTLETPPDEHFAGYEDINFMPARGGIKVGFKGDDAFETTLGCRGEAWGGEGLGDPHGFIPSSKIGDSRIVVPISGSYSQSGDISINGTLSGTLTMTRVGGLRADPGGPYTVRRANRIRLDGSGSSPRREITNYIWKFKMIDADCEEGQLTQTRKRGRTTRIAVLCGLRVTLTVVARDGDHDSASTIVRVRPRGPKGWRTRLLHREKTGDPQTPREPPQAISVGGEYGFALDGALNASDCGTQNPDLILCPPKPPGRSWLGEGYELARVDDPNGPFDGFSYVASTSLTVKRAALINPSILPGSAFYQHNLGAGRDIAGFLAAVRQHEGMGNGTPGTGHSQIMKAILGTPNGNPRRVIERLFAPSREGARKRVDKALHAIDRRLDEESEDPLPDIWTGTLDFFEPYQGKWITAPGFRVPGNSG